MGTFGASDATPAVEFSHPKVRIARIFPPKKRLWTALDGWNSLHCGLWTDPPGQRWEDFRHATDELIMVLEGKVEFEVAGKVYHPRVGEELLIPAGAMHSARNIGKTTARWLYGYRECR